MPEAVELEWEEVTVDTARLKVPGGWIYACEFWGDAGEPAPTPAEVEAKAAADAADAKAAAAPPPPTNQRLSAANQKAATVAAEVAAEKKRRALRDAIKLKPPAVPAGYAAAMCFVPDPGAFKG